MEKFLLIFATFTFNPLKLQNAFFIFEEISFFKINCLICLFLIDTLFFEIVGSPIKTLSKNFLHLNVNN